MFYIIIESEYNNVVNYFNTHNDNRTSAIAKALKLSNGKTNYLIDVYLSKKANFMGEAPEETKAINGNCKRIEAFDIDNKSIGVFDSCTSCSEALNICKYAISRCLQGVNSKTRQGYTFQEL